MERRPKSTSTALTVLAVLAVIAALYLLKPILVPVALAFLLACLLSPLTTFLRRVLPIGPTGAAVLLFFLTVLLGLYIASLTAESLVQAANTLPGEIEQLSGGISRRISEMVRDQPRLRTFLPEPGTIDLLGDANRALLIDHLSYGLADLSVRMAQGLVVLTLVLFLLAESEMLTPKVIRFFAPSPGDAVAASRALSSLTRQIRAYLVARTLINLGLGLVIALALWVLKVKFAFALGVIAGLTNFVPYVGQVIGGALADPDRLRPHGLDRRCPDRGVGLPGGRWHRGLRRHAVHHGPIARHERDDGADRLPVLGLSVGPGGPGPGHADHGVAEAGLPERA